MPPLAVRGRVFGYPSDISKSFFLLRPSGIPLRANEQFAQSSCMCAQMSGERNRGH
jgi:hypothetical protein